jgi:HAD superfamily hydrolase (TIGR01662 family)
MERLLILTLDGTLITTLSGRKYSVHSEDWKFIIQAVEAIKDYHKRGYKIFIMSNQLAIYNNIISDKSFLRKMNLIVNTLERDLPIKVNSICYDYCIDEESYRFLPKPGMLYEFAVDHEIDLINSVFIGSSLLDKNSALSVGIKNYIDVTNLTYEL